MNAITTMIFISPIYSIQGPHYFTVGHQYQSMNQNVIFLYILKTKYLFPYTDYITLAKFNRNTRTQYISMTEFQIEELELKGVAMKRA